MYIYIYIIPKCEIYFPSSKCTIFLRYWLEHLLARPFCDHILFSLDIVIQNSVTHSAAQIEKSNSDPSNTTEDNEEPKATGMHVRDLLTNHVFIYKTKGMPAGEIHSVQCHSRHI